MKKVIIILIIFSLTFISFLIFNKKENINKINNSNISVILQTEEGNVESDTFPIDAKYIYDKVVCENTKDIVYANFNEETRKLNLSLEGNKLDGTFNCKVYFKDISVNAVTKIKEVYNSGSKDIIKLNQPATEQTPALVEYRYSGSNEEVKNYVSFNNEIWRIIGVFSVENENGDFEERLKIIRKDKIGNYTFDISDTSINKGYGISQWGESGTYNGAALMRLLNPGYESESINDSLYWNRESGTCYNGLNFETTPCDFSSTGLTSDAKSMIGDAKWYTSSAPFGLNSGEYYKEIRKKTTKDFSDVDGVTRTTNWIGKIGLIYPEDYGYANKNCYSNTDLSNYNDEECMDSNWIFDEFICTMIAREDYANVIFYVNNEGRLYGNYTYWTDRIYPTIYLKPNVRITSGDGTLENPYKLTL